MTPAGGIRVPPDTSSSFLSIVLLVLVLSLDGVDMLWTTNVALPHLYLYIEQ